MSRRWSNTITIVAFCLLVNHYFDHNLTVLFIAGTFSALYYAAMQLWGIKDKILMDYLQNKHLITKSSQIAPNNDK